MHGKIETVTEVTGTGTKHEWTNIHSLYKTHAARYAPKMMNFTFDLRKLLEMTDDKHVCVRTPQGLINNLNIPVT